MTQIQLSSWKSISSDSDFSIYNIPFGIYSDNNIKHRACSAIGDEIIDLYELAAAGLIELDLHILESAYLNDFIDLGKAKTNAIRISIQMLLDKNNSSLQGHANLIQKVFKKQSEVKMCMPIRVGDYTDFYSSIDHATNIGTMIRDPKNALMPNWKHLPVAYHGRASSVCVSGHSFHRPKGQQKPADSEMPVFGATKALDIELETAFIIGKATNMGESVSTANADDYIFGMVLFNDWSARDIQTWEY
ncbi:MAG: fumarylacetoacetate hydrolase family protein, partial [Bacteroidota bacterium]